MRLAFALLFLGGGLWAVAAADPPAARKTDPAKVRERFYSVWLEIEKVEEGKRSTEPFGLCGLEFGEDKWSAWDRRGELSAARADRGVRIDATADPMRVDFLDGTDAIKPGIFKFDGEQLVLALPGWVRERALGKGEDYPARPKAFESTKDNGVVVTIHRRGRAMYDQD